MAKTDRQNVKIPFYTIFMLDSLLKKFDCGRRYSCCACVVNKNWLFQSTFHGLNYLIT